MKRRRGRQTPKFPLGVPWIPRHSYGEGLAPVFVHVRHVEREHDSRTSTNGLRWRSVFQRTSLMKRQRTSEQFCVQRGHRLDLKKSEFRRHVGHIEAPTTCGILYDRSNIVSRSLDPFEMGSDKVPAGHSVFCKER